MTATEEITKRKNRIALENARTTGQRQRIRGYYDPDSSPFDFSAKYYTEWALPDGTIVKEEEKQGV